MWVGINDNEDGLVYNYHNSPLIFGTNDSERLRIDSSGQVVIGTTSALGKLHVRAADECNFVVREESTALVLSAETNSGRDNNRMMALEGSAYSFTVSGTEKLRIESNGTVNQTTGAFSDNLTYGGRTFTVNHDIRTTSLRGGVLVRNMNNFRSETNAASFMVYDAYDTTAKTFAFRVARGATLSDKFWVKTDGSAYFADKVGIGNNNPSYILDVEGGASSSQFTSIANWNFSTVYIKRKASNIAIAKMISMMLDGDNASDTTLTNSLNIWGTYSGAPTTSCLRS